MHVDDTLEVFTCHGVGGIIGALYTGLFAQASINGYIDGSFYGNRQKEAAICREDKVRKGAGKSFF